MVISQGQVHALVRLVIWIGVIVIFYLVVLADAALIQGTRQGGDAAAWYLWALLLFPLFLLPYLFSLARAVRRADEVILDGRDKTVYKRKRALAAFENIRALELRTVHGTCEEYRLSTVLEDGRIIELVETEASATIEALAREISQQLEVPLIHKI